MNETQMIALLCTLALVVGGCAADAKAQRAGAPSAASVTSSMRVASAGGGGASAPSRSKEEVMDGLRSRASCAAIEMAIALGDRVSKRDRKLCEGQPKVKEAPKETVLAPTAKQAAILAAPPTKAHTSRPEWIDRPPSEVGTIYGVGEGRDAKEAFSSADDRPDTVTINNAPSIKT
jgi:hypothetical protein